MNLLPFSLEVNLGPLNLKPQTINQGFCKEDILIFIDELKVDEKSIYEKEYQKLYNKLSKKYEGYELENKIKQKLYQKGLYRQ